MKTIYLAGGCFWGTEHFLKQFKGVLNTEVGYANGNTKNPTYEDVCYNNTGHAEAVRVDYDENVLPTQKLLNYYFMSINPLSINRQGNDCGTQYRTGIYYTDNAQLADINKVVDEQEQKVGAKLAVEVEPLKNFYPAEQYHQDYLAKHPTEYCHIPNSLMNIENS